MKIRPVIVKHRYINSYSFHNLLNELLNSIYYCAYLYRYPFKYYFVNICFALFIINIVLLKLGDVERNPGPGNTSTNQNYCLTIYHHNIRSIRDKINDIVHIVQDLDIVFFTEAHLDGYIDSENIFLPGFEKPIRKDRQSAGYGVMVYFKNNIRFSRRDDLESANVESMWFELFTKQSSILVNHITYRSERQCDPYFFTLFDDMLKAAMDENVNIAGADPKIGKNMIFWRKMVIFHTKYPKTFCASLRSAQFL